jgi:type VI protein secretion system component VasK
MVDKEQKILKRDDKLLKNEKSWRRARIGAIFFSIIHIIILVTLKRDEFLSPEEQKEALVYMGMWLLFWLLVVSWLNMRLRHIESIKLYRKKESEAVKE